MKTLYLQIGDSTSTYYLDIVSDFDMDLPSADYKLINTLGEGGIVLGTGVKRGRELGCSYNFVKNKEYERDTFIDWFTKTKDITTYLYKWDFPITYFFCSIIVFN